MHSRALLRATSALRTEVRGMRTTQSRGMPAVKNYKRPSMDEYGVPTEAWATVNARTQKKYNAMLAGGAVVAALTGAYCWTSDKTVFHTVPRHLIEVPKK